MAIRPREWRTRKGLQKAWVVDYFDAQGKRRNKQFRTMHEADDWRPATRVDLKQGTHVADSASPTVAEAGKLWIAQCEADGLEPSTIELYQGYLDNHIAPFIGNKRL